VDSEALHRRAREKGVQPVVYWLMRAIVQPLGHLYFRMSRIGREHVPAEGPVILASNHRSFLDPFILGTIARRPIYYVAKEELFRHPVLGWLLNALGAFPVSRGTGDEEMVRTAKAILARGDAVLIFPEGTRVRPGPLGRPKRGVGRLVLETGAPVVPVAITGTEAVRNGWRFRPHKVRVRIGRPLTFPRVEHASPQLAAAVTDRIWPCVMLQWEWLGGLPPLRRAAVIGAGSWGMALAAMLARAGVEVELGARSAEAAAALDAARADPRELPGVALPAGVRVRPASELELARHDLVAFAVPAHALPAVMAEHGAGVPARASVVVRCAGLVPPLGTSPSAYVAERTLAAGVAALGGPAGPAEALAGEAGLVVGAPHRGLGRQLTDALAAAGVRVTLSGDVRAVERAAGAVPSVPVPVPGGARAA
jgi:1-acyl-sn-glycerol-3-phosphate acyltransferase